MPELEEVLERTRMIACLKGMRASIDDFFDRVPGKAPYPTGREKDLYAPFAHILLSKKHVMIPLLLRELRGPAARALPKRLAGDWRAYRVSTVRRDRGTHWKDPHCFPGGAGRGAISDVVLVLNPSFHGKRVSGDLLLYFELKSSDHGRHNRRQIKSHLSAIAATGRRNVFLGAVGGRCFEVKRKRWLGHLSLSRFLDTTERKASGKLRADIRWFRKELSRRKALTM